LRLAFLAQIVTLMLGMTWPEDDIPMEMDDESQSDIEEGKMAMKLLLAVRQAAGLTMPPAWLNPANLWHRITQEWYIQYFNLKLKIFKFPNSLLIE
jgi:hypothetical protein